MSTDVNDEFDEFVADEGRHLLVIGQQQLAEHGANLILVTAQETHPLPVDEVLSEHQEHCPSKHICYFSPILSQQSYANLLTFRFVTLETSV